jgi:hypothetical protein
MVVLTGDTGDNCQHQAGGMMNDNMSRGGQHAAMRTGPTQQWEELGMANGGQHVNEGDNEQTMYNTPPLLQTRDVGVSFLSFLLFFLFFSVVFLFFYLSISDIPPLRAPARRVMEIDLLSK